MNASPVSSGSKAVSSPQILFTSAPIDVGDGKAVSTLARFAELVLRFVLGEQLALSLFVATATAGLGAGAQLVTDRWAVVQGDRAVRSPGDAVPPSCGRSGRSSGLVDQDSAATGRRNGSVPVSNSLTTDDHSAQCWQLSIAKHRILRVVWGSV